MKMSLEGANIIFNISSLLRKSFEELSF